MASIAGLIRAGFDNFASDDLLWYQPGGVRDTETKMSVSFDSNQQVTLFHF